MRTSPQHPVALVLDGDFGQRLVDLAARLHVWTLDSPVNRAVAERIRANSLVASRDRGVTLFRASSTASPEDILADQIGVVFEHHGPLSHDPPMDAVEVYGVTPSAAVVSLLTECGWGEVSVTESGLVARQPRAV